MFGVLLSRTLSVCVCYSSMKWFGEGLPGLVYEISEWIEYCINRLSWVGKIIYIKAIIEVLPITFSNPPELSAKCSRKTLRTLVIWRFGTSFCLLVSESLPLPYKLLHLPFGEFSHLAAFQGWYLPYKGERCIVVGSYPRCSMGLGIFS